MKRKTRACWQETAHIQSKVTLKRRLQKGQTNHIELKLRHTKGGRGKKYRKIKMGSSWRQTAG